MGHKVRIKKKHSLQIAPSETESKLTLIEKSVIDSAYYFLLFPMKKENHRRVCRECIWEILKWGCEKKTKIC